MDMYDDEGDSEIIKTNLWDFLVDPTPNSRSLVIALRFNTSEVLVASDLIVSWKVVSLSCHGFLHRSTVHIFLLHTLLHYLIQGHNLDAQ